MPGSTTSSSMLAYRKRPCPICVWRNAVLPNDEPDSPVSDFHTPVNEMHDSDRSDINIDIMTAMHNKPHQIWIDILSTEKLVTGCVIFPLARHDPKGRRWFRFPTRSMRSMSLHPAAHHQTETTVINDYHGETIVPSVKPGDVHGTFTVYHMTKLEHLVQGHEKAPGSDGILKGGGMCNGTWHGDGIGVYGYASPPYELLSPGDGYVILELKTHMALTRVKGGSKGRYLAKALQVGESIGTPCTDTQVMAVLHLYDSLPDFLKF